MSEFTFTQIGGISRQFTYHHTEPMRDITPLDDDYVPPIHKDIFKTIMESFKMPESQRDPYAPKGQKGWQLGDPISELIMESAIPLGPGIIPYTRQRKMVRHQVGTHGIATHVNLLVDVSSSMNNQGDGQYGFIDGYPFGGEDMVRIAAAVVIEACSLNRDTFAIYEFGSSARTIISPASDNYAAALDWILGPSLAGNADAPFSPSGYTNIQEGIRLVNEEMDLVRNQIQGAITIVLCDGEPYAPGANGGGGVGPHRYNHLFFNDYGPAKVGVANGPTPGEVFAVARDDTYHRDNFGPIVYVWVGGENNRQYLEDLVNLWSEIIRDHNPGLNCSNCVLDFTIAGGEGATAFAGTLLDIANGTSGGSSILANCEGRK